MQVLDNIKAVLFSLVCAMSTHSLDLLTVNEASLAKDRLYKVPYLTDKQRKDYRLIIHKGRFYRDNPKRELFNGENKLSHGKCGFISFTFNQEKELSVFNHLGSCLGAPRLCHSSMNGERPIIAAGELEIDQQGRLISLTNHSGHYWPGIESLCHFLNAIEQLGVNLFEVTIYLKSPPTNVLSPKKTRPINLKNGGYYYPLKAKTLINSKDYRHFFKGRPLSYYCPSTLLFSQIKDVKQTMAKNFMPFNRLQ
jgi:hypothetical protein